MVFEKIINEENTPTRLKGLKVTATFKDSELTFVADLPENPTNQELGYLNWYIGEVIDSLREQFPGWLGDSEIEVRKE